MKKVCFFIMLLALLGADGQLNVFTGDKDAEVFIDGQFIAKEQVLQRALQGGTHYLQVKKNGNILKSRVVEIQDNKLETVVLEDFVDYKTNVPSRGSLDVEAMRVRETRGNLAFGLFGGSPASGLSLKWWPLERVGLQAIGFANNNNTARDTRAGGRLLFAFNESVYQSSTFTIYSALGLGRSALLFIDDDNGESATYDLQELVFGLEFRVADFFQTNNNEYKHIVINKDTSALDILLIELLLGVGEFFLRTAHWSVEVGAERTFTRYFASDAKPSTDYLNLKFSGGCHIYF
ncbi:MAG: hypothetical protein LBL50_00260 [Candidatus Margulisbacteria bacterium]|jgi:hypothetical protein|nr:hypothetical protein [Candidatus Margulisiibacteriota bacterium]